MYIVTLTWCFASIINMLAKVISECNYFKQCTICKTISITLFYTMTSVIQINKLFFPSCGCTFITLMLISFSGMPNRLPPVFFHDHPMQHAITNSATSHNWGVQISNSVQSKPQLVRCAECLVQTSNSAWLNGFCTSSVQCKYPLARGG